MTPPRKWFLDRASEDSEDIILTSHKGPLKAHKASRPLGPIRSVSVADSDKYELDPNSEAIVVCL